MRRLIEKYNNIPTPAKAAFWFVFCSFLQKAISLLTTPIFTRLLTQYEYGQIALYNSWYEIISIIASFKLSEAVFSKTLVSYNGDKREVLSSYQILSFIVGIVIFIIYMLLHKMINSIIGLSYAIMLFMFFHIIVDSIIKLWSAYQRFTYEYTKLIIITITLAILNPILGIILVYFSRDKVFARIMSMVIIHAVVALFLLRFNFNRINRRKIHDLCKTALLFNIPLMPHYLSQVLLNQADRIMINWQIGAEAVAMYSLAYTIGMLVTMITQSINNAYVPWLYNALKIEHFYEIKKFNKLLLFVVVLIISGVCLVAPELIVILGGEQYKQAVYVVYPVAASVYFIFVYTLFANIELYYSKRIYVMIGTMGSAVLNIILNYWGIKYFGYIAAAYTTLICYIIYGIFHIFVSERILYKNVDKKIALGKYEALLFGGMSILISLIFLFFEQFWIIRYGLIIIFGIILLLNYRKIMVALKNIVGK